MKTNEVNKELIGKRCECTCFGSMETGVIESGSLEYLRLLPEPVRPDYETLIVAFSEPIRTLERRIFDDPQAWGASTLKEWIDSYESTRFTQIDDRTAVITSEYNMASVREWLAKHTEIETCKTA